MATTVRRARQCEVCGISYRPNDYRQRTCGRVCGAQINSHYLKARLKREEPKASKVHWSECVTCKAPFTARGGKRCGCSPKAALPQGWTGQRPCVDCPTVIELHPLNTRRLRCDPCLLNQKRRDKDKRRALKREAYREDVYRAKIYERDGYRCKLCNKRLKVDAVVPHPLAPTLDHIIPLACGGTHEPSNVQAAHFLCNSTKGHRGGGEQLLLIG